MQLCLVGRYPLTFADFEAQGFTLQDDVALIRGFQQIDAA